MAAYKKLRADILKVLIDHPRKQSIHVDTIVAKTGFTPEQVKTSMNNMIKDGLPVKVISRASLWLYMGDAEQEATAAPTTSRAGEVWEVVGIIKSTGAMILRDENGILYRATEME
jgi:hypothetical protein